MSVKKMLGKLRRKIRLFRTLLKESYSTMKYSTNDDVPTEMLLLSHSLEKGMGLKHVKHGYGINKAQILMSYLENFNDIYCFEYQESCAVLKAYIDYQEKSNVDVTVLKERYNKLTKIPKSLKGGNIIVNDNELLSGMNFDFSKFVKSRHSLRKYSSEAVDKEEVEQAISIAIGCPSACNRQPWKCYYTFSSEKNVEIGRLLMGNKGFESDIPYYAVITVSKRFFSWHEPYQWYVNGGIFLSFLVLAFHSLGIGSCIFQWPDFCKDECSLRTILNLGNSEEAIIAVVGYGKYPTEAKCLASQRRDIFDVAVNLDAI